MDYIKITIETCTDGDVWTTGRSRAMPDERPLLDRGAREREMEALAELLVYCLEGHQGTMCDKPDAFLMRALDVYLSWNGASDAEKLKAWIAEFDNALGAVL